MEKEMDKEKYYISTRPCRKIYHKYNESLNAYRLPEKKDGKEEKPGENQAKKPDTMDE